MTVINNKLIMNKKNTSSRRFFFKELAFTGAGLASLPYLAKASVDVSETNIPQNLTILFQGDSITDAGRNRGRYYANDAGGLGNGYVFQIIADLLGAHPNKNLRCYNRGISGNKVYQLAERWDDDCLFLKPDVLSILIGVNDFWHTLSGNYQGTADTYNDDFRALLDRTKKQFPNIKFIIGEPFAVKGGTAITSQWDKDFPEYQKFAKLIARDYGAVFIPYQEVFEKALAMAPASYWCPDGVHPSIAGAYLMKNAWLEGLQKIFNQD
jgi:lysophospholipase L1-like esterase